MSIDPAVLILALITLAFGAALALTWRARQQLTLDLAAERQRSDALNAALQAAQLDVVRGEERTKNLEAGLAEMTTVFEATSAKVLEAASASFLRQADARFEAERARSAETLGNLIKPVQETLGKFDAHVRVIETARADAYGALRENLVALTQGLEATRTETAKLSTALKGSAKTRGRWGEETLKNVLEQAGVGAHVSFIEQGSLTGADGQSLRPDFQVRLPGGGCFVIDSKAPLDAYLEAVEATDDEARNKAMGRYALAMRTHMRSLANKGYTDALDFTPDVVAMFVPGENFCAAAFEHDPTLFQDAFDAKVVIVTPATLFALLKSVSFGWRIEDQAKNARAIADLGRELYKRIAKMTEHAGAVGDSLQRAVGRYNEFVGSLEARVLPQARKFEELSVDHASASIPEIPMLEATVRPVSVEPLEETLI
jgi:DNA recombination protein RmuC